MEARMKRPLVVALVLALSATGAWADRYSDCDQSADPDRRIRGCTQVIERGERESSETRSFAYTNRGNAYDDKGEVDRAIADYTKAIALDPNYAFAYNNRGLTYEKKGEIDRAIADYTKAIALDPKNAIAYTNRGAAYYSKGALDRAIADFDEAIKLNPNYAITYTNRGYTYEKKGDKDQAIADFRKALEINPSDQDAKDNLKRLGVTP